MRVSSFGEVLGFSFVEPDGLQAVGVAQRGTPGAQLTMDFDARDGVSLAEQDDEALLRRLHRLLAATRIFCSLCNVESTCPAALDDHVGGQKHRAVVRARCLRAEDVAAGAYYGFNSWCELCGKECTTEKAYSKHAASAPHEAAERVQLKLWALRFAITAICEELHRRNVALPDVPLQYLPLATGSCAGAGAEAKAGVESRVEAEPVTEAELEAAVRRSAETKSGFEAESKASVVEAESKASVEPIPVAAPAGNSGGGQGQGLADVGSEVVNLARSLDEMASSVSGMAASMEEVATSLGVVHGRVGGQNHLLDAVYRRIATVEMVVASSRAWQSGIEASITSIGERLCGDVDE